MRKKSILGILLFLMLFFVACSSEKSVNTQKVTESVKEQKGTEEGTKAEEVQEPEILNFVDVYGTAYQVEINPNIAENPYQKDAFVLNGDRMSYADEEYTYRLGVDVSKYQGNIDWEKVKSAGVEFVIIRIGYRGYGEEGVMQLDSSFHQNIQGAQEVGLDVGVYFFAQAINEQEAIEEAEFVLQHLEGYDLQMPVVYDPESILHDDARTDDVTGEQFTKNTKAFCETIKNAGLKPMVYCNMLWQAFELDLEELADYPIWYADYERFPQTPYHFEIWQYTCEGSVDGINGNVDLNIQMIER